MISFVSARTGFAAFVLVLGCFLFGTRSTADKLSSYSASPSFTSPSNYGFTAPKLPASFGYKPPRFAPRSYTPPPHVTPKPRPYHRPAGYNHAPKPRVKPHQDVGSRVVYVPVPKVEGKGVFVANQRTVKKTVRVHRYGVEKVHADRCIKIGPTNVYLQPSYLSDVLGNVISGETVHVTQCLTDDDKNRHWCALKNAKGIEAWIPAKHLQLCGW